LDGDRVLYIRGGGDPFLISEDLAQLASKLVAAIGTKPLTGIVLDASYYPSDIRIPGIEDTDEAYDALNSALAVNFNTIHAVRQGKTVRSAEKQTPITPLAVSQFLARGPKGRGRISLTQDAAVGLQYAGELIAAFIERAGGSAKGKISAGAVPEGLEPVYVHRQSRTRRRHREAEWHEARRGAEAEQGSEVAKFSRLPRRRRKGQSYPHLFNESRR
jgi:D-alanyl-D-alanine carboxypeptidase/D-alanyl-D-alanine-endopeptidase (penicillin-binding protein 4)